VTKKSPRLKRLLDRVARVCENKAALARELGVSSNHIYQWITAREYEPGGETTLHLLEWVEKTERQQKEKSGHALTRPERKTRIRKSTYEKTNSGQQKR